MLGRWRREHHGREMEGLCGTCDRALGQNTVDINPDECPDWLTVTLVDAQILPQQQKGQTEAERLRLPGRPSSLLSSPFSFVKWMPRSSSVLVCSFLLKACMISHVFFFSYFVFVHHVWQSEWQSKEFQVGLCSCVWFCPSVPWLSWSEAVVLYR